MNVRELYSKLARVRKRCATEYGTVLDTNRIPRIFISALLLYYIGDLRWLHNQ